MPNLPGLPGLPGAPAADRCLVMSVVNVTPDSFSDGGQWYGAEAAIQHGLELVAQGADIVDVGGESTRPGAQRVSAEEELRRVKPVITELVKAGVVVSVDTMRAQVAEFALEAGVSLVNDVSGGLADPYMPRLVAKAGVPYVVMHWRGHSHDMNSRAVYQDVVREVRDELGKRIEAMTAEGVDPSLIVIDPGLGFSKLPGWQGPDAHNWELLTRLREVAHIGGRDFPVLVGASRKRHLGRLLAAPDGTPRPFTETDDATVAVTALVAVAGAWCVRVHRVPANADAVRVAAAWRSAAARAMTPPAARPVVLALGSNLGDRRDILHRGVDAIAAIPEVEVMAVSPVYETGPVGGPPQPDYLNAVLLARTTLPSRVLLDRLREIEAAFDRERTVRWGPRTLDIDIITVTGEVSADPDLTLPHPRAHERAFVLAPWHDVDPDAVLPGHGQVATLLAAADRSGIRRASPGGLFPRMGGSRAPSPLAPGTPRRAPDPPDPIGRAEEQA